MAAIYHPDSSPPREVVLSGTVEVPMISGPSGDHPAVQVTLDGHGPYTFLVEAGAGFVGVSKAIAQSLKLKRVGGPDEHPGYWLDELAVGDAVFRQLPVNELELAMPGVDGILGLSLYRDVLLTLDYPHGKVRLARGALPEADGREVLALSRVKAFWAIPIAVGDRQLEVVLDTQADGGLGLPPAVAAQLPFVSDPVVIGKARGAFGETEVKGGELAAPLRVGRYEFPHPFVTVRALPPEWPNLGTMGGRVLKNFTVTIDQRNGRIALRHEGSAPLELARPKSNMPAAASSATKDSGPPAEELAHYAGKYGMRTISVQDGRLYLQREGGEPLQMVASGHDAFALAAIPEARIEFQRDAGGKVVGMRVLNAHGDWETAQKKP